MNRARVLLLLALGFMLSMALAVYVVTSLLEEWLDPRHAEMMANRQIIELSMAIDSLEKEVANKDRYVLNIKQILDGNTVDPDSLISFESRRITEEVMLDATLNPIDSQFRAEYESSDLGLFALRTNEYSELREMLLFRPVEGIITDGFNASDEHFGVDIVSKENEAVKSVADGVVVFSSWTLDGGYVIAVQHRANLISVYKHNSELLKNVGNFVSAGEILAIIGNTGELTSGPHLHLELWHRGNPVDPENYIDF